MQLKKYRWLLPVLIVGAGLALYLQNSDGVEVGKSDEAVESVQYSAPLDAIAIDPIYSRDGFYPAIQAEYDAVSKLKSIKGMIINHHDIASSMIANGYAQLQHINPNVDTIVLIGPNHTQMGNGYVSSGKVYYTTPQEKDVYLDYDFLDLLEGQQLVAYENDIMQVEHSMGLQAPFIAHYFPNARIVPLIFQADYDDPHNDRLLEKILEYVGDDENTIIIASIDFSHYLSTQRSNQMDKESLDAIKKWDTDMILTWNDEHMDGRSTMKLFLDLMQELGATDIDVVDHKNSADILGHELMISTGYYTILFGDE